ncbi:MAG: hypothetical protein ACK456_00565, partial [Pseudanabaenaceae cyanobacterium]
DDTSKTNKKNLEWKMDGAVLNLEIANLCLDSMGKVGDLRACLRSFDPPKSPLERGTFLVFSHLFKGG